MAASTYFVARRYLIAERESAAERQAYVNARLVRTVLRGDNPDLSTFLNGLGGGAASNQVVHYRGEWFSNSVAVGANSLPAALIAKVDGGAAAHQRVRSGNSTLQLVVGVHLAAVDASYFEVFPLADLDRTLSLVGRVLLGAAALSAVVAALLGRASARQLVKPLVPVEDAAERIANGALDTRLDEAADPDFRRLFRAFNSMAEALETRIDREARFAADVSHELRSPLTAVAAAVEIIERRREQLPPQVIEAFTVLSQKIEGFQRMVLDLLEISRMDAGTAVLDLEPIPIEPFVTRLATSHGLAADVVTVAPGAPRTMVADRRRAAQAIGNIIDNAARYAGGTSAISVECGQAGMVRIQFDDRGPGVDPAERQAIFGRFARGAAGLDAGTGSGTGLGLALVAEHVALQAGSVWVEDAPGGGSRFVVELPVSADA